MSNISQCIFIEVILYLQAAGISLLSNMFQPSPPYRPRPRPIRKFTSVLLCMHVVADCSCIIKYHTKRMSTP